MLKVMRSLDRTCFRASTNEVFPSPAGDALSAVSTTTVRTASTRRLSMISQLSAFTSATPGNGSMYPIITRPDFHGPVLIRRLRMRPSIFQVSTSPIWLTSTCTHRLPSTPGASKRWPGNQVRRKGSAPSSSGLPLPSRSGMPPASPSRNRLGSPACPSQLWKPRSAPSSPTMPNQTPSLPAPPTASSAKSSRCSDPESTPQLTRFPEWLRPKVRYSVVPTPLSANEAWLRKASNFNT